jgi:uncharacterized protein (TIGR03084 family)
MQQAKDFLDESKALKDLLENVDDDGIKKPTLFKNWTVEDVVGHLYLFNYGAIETLKGDTYFEEFWNPINTAVNGGQTLVEAQVPWLDGLSGRKLIERWWDSCEKVYDAYKDADPKKRVKWGGPEMSARSKITARHMETWAHGQEIFDILGKDRQEQDRIKNIVHMGIIAYGWTFVNRKLDVPKAVPYVKLEAPSGSEWEWNEKTGEASIYGSAVEFAQVVTQVRNIEDTSLVIEGASAKDWMKYAQCFAGPPEDPPEKGTRYKANI